MGRRNLKVGHMMERLEQGLDANSVSEELVRPHPPQPDDKIDPPERSGPWLKCLGFTLL